MLYFGRLLSNKGSMKDSDFEVGLRKVSLYSTENEALAGLATFTEEILHGKLHFLHSAIFIAKINVTLEKTGWIQLTYLKASNFKCCSKRTFKAANLKFPLLSEKYDSS